MARPLRLESEGGIYHVLNRGNYRSDLATSGKSADWKIAIAAALEARTTVTNRWLATTLHLGNLYEVSRKVAVWMRNPEPTLAKKTPDNPKPQVLTPFWIASLFASNPRSRGPAHSLSAARLTQL